MRISKERRELIGGFTQNAIKEKKSLTVGELVEMFNQNNEDATTIEELSYALTRFIATTPKKDVLFDCIDEENVVLKENPVGTVEKKEEPALVSLKDNDAVIGLMAEMATALYGILNFEELATVINHYHDLKCVKDDILPALTNHIELSGAEVGYTVFEGFVINPILLPDALEVTDTDVALIDSIREEQKECDRYLPDYETFATFSNITIASLGLPYEQFVSFIEKNINKLSVTMTDAHESLDRFYLFSKAGLSPDRFIEFFREEGFKFISKGFMDDFVSHAIRVYAKVRIYSINGFTPLELQANPELLSTSLEEKNTVRLPIVKEVIVGRNDPCPCGSNKKYKKCCL